MYNNDLCVRIQSKFSSDLTIGLSRVEQENSVFFFSVFVLPEENFEIRKYIRTRILKIRT